MDNFDYTSDIVYYFPNNIPPDKNAERLCTRLNDLDLEEALKDVSTKNLGSIEKVKVFLEETINNKIIHYNHNSNYNYRLWIDNVDIIELSNDEDVYETYDYCDEVLELLEDVQDFYVDRVERNINENDFIYVILFEISVLPKGKPLTIIGNY